MGEAAGIWLRVSTKQQDEASQIPDIASWIDGHEYDTAKTYTVHGGSAFKGNRKFDRTWASVLDDMRNGRIRVLVAWKTDRIDRKLETFKMLAEVVEAGGRVEFVTQPHLNDLTTMGGRIALKVQEEIAYAESKDKSDRVKATQAGLRDRKKLVGRYPWGYASAGAKYSREMIATGEGEQYASEAFTRIADGHMLDDVAGWLRGRTGQVWHPRTVAAMIRNTSYRGEHRDAKGDTICKCPALVSGDLWRNANANLDARPSSRRGQRNDLVNGAALLSGLICCANPACSAGPDSPMCRSGAYYRCTGRSAGNGKRHGCGVMVPVIHADKLMNWNMSRLQLPVLRPVFHPATGHQIELDDVTQQLRDLPAQGLDDDAEDQRRGELRAERKRLMELPAKPAFTSFVPVLDDAGEVLTYGVKWDRSDQAGRRAWLKDAAFTVYLGKPGMVPVDDDDDAYPDEAFCRVETYQNERAALTFVFDGDADGLDAGLPTEDD